jgi:ribosomal protein L37AE/L43A
VSKASTTCPKCAGTDVQRPIGVHLHECENCGHGWDEVERLRADLAKTAEQAAQAIEDACAEAARLRAIVRAFAESDPWMWVDTTGTRRCDHCGATRAGQHTETCAWKLASDEPPMARKESGL